MYLPHTLFIKDIRHKLQVPRAAEYEELRKGESEREKEIWNEFYATDAVIYRNWLKPNQDLRHVIT
jgi:hypothetical protein